MCNLLKKWKCDVLFDVAPNTIVLPGGLLGGGPLGFCGTLSIALPKVLIGEGPLLAVGEKREGKETEGNGK